MRIPIGYPAKPDSRGRARKRHKGKVYDFGIWGTPESHEAYRQFLLQSAKPAEPRSDGLTVAELVARWMTFEESGRGREHPEVIRIHRACQPLLITFGDTLVEDFKAARLLAVQEAMVTQAWMTLEQKAKCGDWSRGYINRSIDRIRRVFRWGESRGYVPAGTWEHLKTVSPIRHTDRRVRATPPVEPADWQTQIQPCLAHVSEQVAAMMQVQFFAGMRPGEVLAMRPCDLDRDSVKGVWLYRPANHKGAWRSVELVKALGPQAQSILAPWLLMCGEADWPIFRPSRRMPRPYSLDGYSIAIRRACMAAGVKHFAPYAIRHAAKKRVTRQFSLDGARAFLGQSSLGATNHYARQHDLETIAEIARKIG